jgi:hypothetical protein
MNALDTFGTDLASGAKEITTATRKAREELSAMPTVTGPTSQSVNEGAPGSPRTFSEFTARGGIKNTAQRMMNEIKTKKIERNLLDANTRIIAAGERGAEALYNDAIATYGSGVTEFIPPKTFYYDEEGTFMPWKYVQAVYLGTQKFKETQKVKSERQMAGTIISGAQSPQAAAAGILGAGQDVKPYEDAVGKIKTPEEIAKQQADVASTKAGTLSTDQDVAKKKLENEWYPAVQQANINEKNANASKNRTGGSGTAQARLTGLNSNLNSFMKERNTLKEANADITKSADPKAVLERQRSIKQYDSIIKNTIDDINETRTKLGYPPMAFDEGAPDDVVFAANEILSGMETMPPQKMEATTSKSGVPAYSKKGGFLWWKWTGEPNEQAYADEVSNRVVGYLESKGISQFRGKEQYITEALKRESLEDVINDMMIIGGGAGGNQQTVQPPPQQQPEPQPDQGANQGALETIFGGSTFGDRAAQSRKADLESTRYGTGISEDSVEKIRKSLKQ